MPVGWSVQIDERNVPFAPEVQPPASLQVQQWAAIPQGVQPQGVQPQGVQPQGVQSQDIRPPESTTPESTTVVSVYRHGRWWDPSSLPPSPPVTPDEPTSPAPGPSMRGLQLAAASVVTVVGAIFAADDSARDAAFMQSQVILAGFTAVLLLLGALHLSGVNFGISELWCGCLLCLPIPNSVSWLRVSTPEELHELEAAYMSSYQSRPLTLFIGAACLGVMHRSFVLRARLRRTTAVAYMCVTPMINPVHIYWLTGNAASFLTSALTILGFGISTVACELAFADLPSPER